MNFDTTSTTVRRETKTTTFSQAAICALASTAAMNALDPDNKATFTSHAETPNADGSVTVSLVIETELVDPPAPAAPAPAGAAPALAAPVAPVI